MLFEIKNMTKIYGDRTVLDLQELVFEKGLIYALLGPNGSGKTTLLDIMSLLSPPTKGTIRYDGYTIDFCLNNLTALRREIVMVHQNPVLFSTTVYKNLEFGLKIRGIHTKQREHSIMDALNMVGMENFAHAQANRLSGGETQRIAIARALVCSPKVLFLDEPTANVDLENLHAIEQIVTEINKEKGITVILTTHNLAQASKIAHRVIALYEGRKVSSIFENLFSGEMSQGPRGESLCTIEKKVRLLVDSQKEGPVRLSLAPHKLQITKGGSPSGDKNRIPGRLVQLSAENGQIRAVVDVGITLNILLYRDDLQREGFLIGDEVIVQCPQEAVTIF